MISEEKMKSKHEKKIPGKTASLVPWGDIVAFFNDYHAYRAKKIAKYGKIHKVRFIRRKIHMFLDKDAVNFVLIKNSKKFSSKKAWDLILKDLFPNGLMLMDGEQHKHHRSIINEAFKKEPMEGYLEMMKTIVPSHFAQWHDSTPKLAVSLKALTLEIAMGVFFGLSKDQQFPQINEAITAIVDASSALPIKLPFTRYKKGINARKYLVRFFGELLPERKKSPGNDLFSVLVMAKNEEGQSLEDQQIIDHLIFMLMAAHDTTASTLTSMCYFLAKHPEWQNKLRTESQQFYEEHGVDFVMADLRKLDQLDLVLKETLRRFPPLVTLGRESEEPMDYKGYFLPAGTRVNVDFHQNHHDPDIWSCPMNFDPERFSKERSEHTSCPHTYTPFGAGVHHCIGFAFADMQIKYIINQLLLSHQWSVPADYEIPMKPVPLQFPEDGLPVNMEKVA